MNINFDEGKPEFLHEVLQTTFHLHVKKLASTGTETPNLAQPCHLPSLHTEQCYTVLFQSTAGLRAR